MGGSSSQVGNTTSPEPDTTDVDDFNPSDLLRHLREHDGYEVYDVFENCAGARVTAPVRMWLEDTEAFVPSVSSTTAESASPVEDQAVSSSEERPVVSDEDSDHWVVLSTREKLGCVIGKGKGKSKGKGKGPPPPKCKAPSPPPKGASKAKAHPKLPPPGKGVGKDKVCTSQAGTGPLLHRKAAVKAPPPPPFGKRLHWKLLPAAAIGDTIFEELQPWGDVAPPLDTQQLERLFAVPPQEKPHSAGAAPVSGGAATTASGGNPTSNGGKGSSLPGRVCLLDAKRAQNLAIVLRQVALPTSELAEILRFMRTSHSVSTEQLEHIYENLLPPLLESAESFHSYEGSPEALRDVERQLLPLSKLPRLKARLQSFLFGKNLPALNDSLQARIGALRDACRQVRDSPSLRRVLGTVLRVGNFLNHGVDSPDAGGGMEVRGFAMESLLKLGDFRARSGGGGGESSVSALHCVVLHLLPAEPRLPSKLREELRTIFEASGEGPSSGSTVGNGGGGGNVAPGLLGIADLRCAVSRFKSDAELVQGEADHYGNCYRLDETEMKQLNGSGPLETLRTIAEDALELAKRLEDELSETLALALRLLEYFGERRRPGALSTSSEARLAEEDASVERFFVTIRDFTVSLETSWKEVLEQPRKLRLDAAVAAAALVSGDAKSSKEKSPSPERFENAKSGSAVVASTATQCGAEGNGNPSSRGSLKALHGAGGLGLLAGEATAAAMRRRSRASLPARPAPRPALNATSACADEGWSCGAGARNVLSAAAVEVD